MISFSQPFADVMGRKAFFEKTVAVKGRFGVETGVGHPPVHSGCASVEISSETVSISEIVKKGGKTKRPLDNGFKVRFLGFTRSQIPGKIGMKRTVPFHPTFGGFPMQR